MVLRLPIRIWWALQRDRSRDSLYRWGQRAAWGQLGSASVRTMGPGVVWTYAVCRQLQQRQNQGNWDLIAAAPAGTLGTMWCLAIAAMHKQLGYPHEIAFSLLWAVRLLVVTVFHFNSLGDPSAWFASLLLTITILFVLPLFDIVLGGLLGMLAPTYGERMSLAIGFVVIHLIALYVVVAIALVVFGLLVAGGLVRAGLVALAVMAGLCYVIPIGLWWLLVRRTNATPEDIRFVLGE